jgi:hypothetical protein
VFSEVSSLLGSPGEHPRGSDSVFPVVLFAAPDVPSKLITSLKILITEKADSEFLGLGASFVYAIIRTYINQILVIVENFSIVHPYPHLFVVQIQLLYKGY